MPLNIGGGVHRLSPVNLNLSQSVHPSLLIELYFIGIVIVISLLGRFHLSTYWKSTPRFWTEEDLDRYQAFASVQM
jgi:hypothetical protein